MKNALYIYIYIYIYILVLIENINGKFLHVHCILN